MPYRGSTSTPPSSAYVREVGAARLLRACLSLTCVAEFDDSCCFPIAAVNRLAADQIGDQTA